MALLIHNGLPYGTSQYTLSNMIKGTLTSGTTEVVFNSPLINANSVIDCYVDEDFFSDIYPKSIVSEAGKCTVTYSKAPDSNVPVAIKLLDTEEYIKQPLLTTGVLAAGDTELVIEDDRINEESILDYYYWSDLGVEAEPLSYKTVKVETGKVTLTFDAMDNDLKVAVKIL